MLHAKITCSTVRQLHSKVAARKQFCLSDQLRDMRELYDIQFVGEDHKDIVVHQVCT